MLNEYPELMTISEMRTALRCGRNKAYQLVQDGSIHAVHWGRKILIPKPEVVKFLKGAKT